MSARIGFYICHCGTNIAGKVAVEEVSAFIRGLRNVAVARDYKFMCSDPGQEMIQKDIREMGLNRVVVASCSPRLHERTFQNACQRAGLNPYYFQMACVREHCSWITEDPAAATRKAKSLAAVADQPGEFSPNSYQPRSQRESGRIGRRRRDRGHPGVSRHRQGGLPGTPGGKGSVHWRAYGAVRQDLSDP